MLGEDDERRVLSPEVRRRLRVAVAVLCVAATVVGAVILVTDYRAQARRQALLERRADALVLAGQTIGIGARVPRDSVVAWTQGVQVNTRDGTPFELLSLVIDGPWTVDAIEPERPSDSHSVTVALVASCATVARLQPPTSAQVGARRPGRRAVVNRIEFDGATLLGRPRADCHLAPLPTSCPPRFLRDGPVGCISRSRTDVQPTIGVRWCHAGHGRTSRRSPIGLLPKVSARPIYVV
ncbi:MAG: hypothetical protein JWM02_1029 [Frankiales bacterium]|nr:hypothetical protein [Frankiales bacterium]